MARWSLYCEGLPAGREPVDFASGYALRSIHGQPSLLALPSYTTTGNSNQLVKWPVFLPCPVQQPPVNGG